MFKWTEGIMKGMLSETKSPSSFKRIPLELPDGPVIKDGPLPTKKIPEELPEPDIHGRLGDPIPMTHIPKELPENVKGDSTLEEKAESSKEAEDKTARYYDDNGRLYRIGNNLLPNTEYDINGYHYETDHRGRIISAEGNLQVKDHDGRPSIKDSMDNIGKGDQKETDDRGHLIGDQFNGSNGMENIVPQDADINRKDYKELENELAKEVKAGKDVHVKVEPIYEGDSHRPTDIIVTYSIDGEESVRFFPNENGR